jgi:hypothetical protein
MGLHSCYVLVYGSSLGDQFFSRRIRITREPPYTELGMLDGADGLFLSLRLGQLTLGKPTRSRYTHPPHTRMLTQTATRMPAWTAL